MTEAMTDIVKRLRGDPDGNEAQHLLDEAADKIERLEHMQANLHGHIKRLEDENAKLKATHWDLESDALLRENDRLREQRDKWCRAYEGAANENAKLREALEEAAKELERDLMPFAASKVRAALQKDEGE